MMLPTPQISVVLPVYNGEKYLSAAIDSILQQSLTGLELIIVNDGSSDGSQEIIERFAAADARVVVIARSNRGLVYSLNEGIGLARGEWIARMDADDIARPDRLHRQLAEALKMQADVVGSDIRFFGARRGRWYLPTEDAAIKVALAFDSPLAHPAILARRSVMLKYPYDESDRHAEDYALWCRMAAAGVRFSNIPDVLLRYRCHPGQVTQTQAAQARAVADRARRIYLPTLLPALSAHDTETLAALLDQRHNLTRDELRVIAGMLDSAGWDVLQRSGAAEGWLDTAKRARPWGPAVFRVWLELACRGFYRRHTAASIFRLMGKSFIGIWRRT